MNQESDRQLAYTTAQLLRAVAWVGAFGLLLTAAALWLAAAGGNRWLAAAALAAGLAAGWAQLRLAFDARLLAGFAEGRQAPEQLDAALSALGLRQAAESRSMKSRCRGALRWLRYAVGLLGLQAVLILCMLMC